MIKYESLVEGVRDRARLDSGHHARTVVEAVVSTLAHGLPPDGRRRLADALPAAVEPAADVTGSSEPRTGSSFVVEVGELVDVPPERARYLAQAVLSELHAEDPELVEALRSQLPADTVEILEEAGEPPEMATTVTADRPTRLSDDEVRRALSGLTGWTGDSAGISRTVSLPDDRIGTLVDRVQREARQMNDRAHVDRGPGTVTFTLRTGAAGVTQPDLWLAERIDAAISDLGSGGRPGQ